MRTFPRTKSDEKPKNNITVSDYRLRNAHIEVITAFEKSAPISYFKKVLSSRDFRHDSEVPGSIITIMALFIKYMA